MHKFKKALMIVCIQVILTISLFFLTISFGLWGKPNEVSPDLAQFLKVILLMDTVVGIALFYLFIADYS